MHPCMGSKVLGFGSSSPVEGAWAGGLGLGLSRCLAPGGWGQGLGLGGDMLFMG